MRRWLWRLRDRVYLKLTAYPADAKQYWAMRVNRDDGQRQPPVPVRTAREMMAMVSAGDAAVVFGSSGSVAALVDAGCVVTHIESDPGRAYGAEFLLHKTQRGRLNSVVIDRGHAEGREAYANAFRDLALDAKLVVVGGRSRAKVAESVAAHAAVGTRVVVVRGGRDRYSDLRASLTEAGLRFRVETGPAADGSDVRTSAIVIDL